MLSLSDGLRQTLLHLQEEWAEERQAAVGKERLRLLIESERIGRFMKLDRMKKEEIAPFLQGKTVAGVDGSSNQFGGSYPGMITLLQAGALTTNREKVLLGDAISPMSSGDRIKIEEYQRRLQLSEQDAFLRYKDARMASLEVEAALKLIGDTPPALLLFDGGFVRYESKAYTQWEEYEALSLSLGIYSFGIIEEVGTNFISRGLQEVLEGKLLPYDRQLLFGVLEPGEVLLLDPSLKHKGITSRYYTCFARLSNHPSIIGIDLFSEQQDGLFPALRFLYANTLEDGRGIPFWIDRVDHEIKLSYRETEALIRTTFPPDWVEKFLVSQRSRRDL